MTRRRTALLVTAGVAVAALAVGSDAAAGGPVVGHLFTGSTQHHDSTATAPGPTAVARSTRPPADAANKPTERGGGTARAGSKAGDTDGRRGAESATEPATSGGIEAGRRDSITRHVRYTGSPTTTFRYPGADYVKVHFSRLLVRPGDWVTVSDESGKQSYTYRGDPRLLHLPKDSPSTVSGSDGFWAMSITGDTAIVTLHKTLPGPGLGKLGVDVDRVAHGFTASQRADREHAQRRAAGGRRPESVCGADESRDAVCYKTSHPVEYKHSLPVARLLINGTTLCTAWRVTADDRMLTNHHCIGSQADAANTEVWFNYQCTTCGGRSVAQVTKVPAAKLLRTDETLDYSLFSVSDFDSIKHFGYLGLDVRRPKAGEQVYIPQHPQGEPTKLSIASDGEHNATCQIDEATIDGYGDNSDTGYRCDTAPGASGSPVIAKSSNRVIALHHLGGCPNSGARIDLIYPQIKSLL